MNVTPRRSNTGANHRARQRHSVPVSQSQPANTNINISIPSIPTCPFEKHFDPKSGRYYHIHKETGESVWDVPITNTSIPLSPPPTESQVAAAKEAQQYATERAKARQERIAIADQFKSEWRSNDAKARAQSDQVEQSRQYTIWKEACQRGAGAAAATATATATAANNGGNVRVSWQKLGYISPQIYTFERDYGRQLIKLCMEGNELDSLGDIPIYCPNLIHLSLASNNIRRLDRDIMRLVHLQHLNLLRNNLEVLPDEIGYLSNLRELEVAGNCLTELPSSICELDNLKRLNVECNNIEELPESIGDVACEELIVNSNALSVLPRSITRMSVLRKLCINDNNVRQLPNDIGNLRYLEVLHASKNCLSELPSSICRLARLQNLWFDYNKLAALPADFHHLRRLEELKMEGNPNMVLPPVEKLVEGARAVLRWSECRYASSKNAQQQSIVMSVQDILRQVDQNRMVFVDSYQPIESMFEANVEYKGHLFYQFLPEALWTVFLPKLEEIWSQGEHLVGIQSFSYDRSDVEQALLNFRDAGGKVAHHQRQAMFRRCSCKNNSADKRACGRLDGGWACQRPAILLRMALVKEKDMAEKRRKNVEKTRIDAAVKSAERVAKRYLSSDEGKQHIRKQAEERVVAQALSAMIDTDKSHNSEEEEDVFSASETTTTLTMGSTVRREIARKAATMKIRLHPSFNKKVQSMEQVLRVEYIDTEADKRRKIAEETNRKMKTILHNWLGMSLDEAFWEWRMAIREAKRGKRRDVKAQMRTDRLKYESELALLEYAKRQLLLWVEHWDEYNDAPYWINKHTDESTYDKPTVERFLPEGWSMPDIPQHIINQETGNMLSQAEIRDAEMDSESSSDEYESSLDGYDSSSVATGSSVPTHRASRVSFLLPNKDEDEEEEVGRVGIDAEAAAAADRILKRRREILLKKQKQQRRRQSIVDANKQEATKEENGAIKQ